MDLGCGPAEILGYLPECDYLGVDINQRYIDQARAKFGHRGTFHCGTVETFDTYKPASFDVVFASGIVHHLDDPQARQLVEIARRSLRFVTVDGCHTAENGIIARFLLSQDRGKYVRTCEGYRAILAESFDEVSFAIRRDLMRAPYCHVFLVSTTPKHSCFA